MGVRSAEVAEDIPRNGGFILVSVGDIAFCVPCSGRVSVEVRVWMCDAERVYLARSASAVESRSWYARPGRGGLQRGNRYSEVRQ